MQAFTTLTSVVAPLDRADVDTDQIIPKQYLKTIARTGLKEGLFADWRVRPDGTLDSDFFSNQPRYQESSILLTRDNFGCGSSREHAPWALLDYGIRSILAPSFADIFYNNCFQNGILPVALTAQEIQTIFDRVLSKETYHITVNLAEQVVLLPEGERYAFAVDPFRKDCMIKGLDGIGLTLQHESAISAYESRRSQEVPWLFENYAT